MYAMRSRVTFLMDPKGGPSGETLTTTLSGSDKEPWLAEQVFVSQTSKGVVQFDDFPRCDCILSATESYLPVRPPDGPGAADRADCPLGGNIVRRRTASPIAF